MSLYICWILRSVKLALGEELGAKETGTVGQKLGEADCLITNKNPTSINKTNPRKPITMKSIFCIYSDYS
jgi:hypothetical protein